MKWRINYMEERIVATILTTIYFAAKQYVALLSYTLNPKP